jgi:hypothetical protein
MRQRPLGRQLLAAKGTAHVDDLAAILGRHAGTETMTAGPYEDARLKSTFRHNIRPRRARFLWIIACARICRRFPELSGPLWQVDRRYRENSRPSQRRRAAADAPLRHQSVDPSGDRNDLRERAQADKAQGSAPFILGSVLVAEGFCNFAQPGELCRDAVAKHQGDADRRRRYAYDCNQFLCPSDAAVPVVARSVVDLLLQPRCLGRLEAIVASFCDD